MTAPDLFQSHDLATEFPALTKGSNLSNAEFQKGTGDPVRIARTFPLRVERCLAYPPHQSNHRVTAATKSKSTTRARGYPTRSARQGRNRRSTQFSPGNCTYPDLIR